MKNILFALGLLTSNTLFATTVEECAPKVGKARIYLVAMLSGKIDHDQQTLVKRSAEQAHICIAEIKAPAGKENQLEELKKVWGEFKTTRENDLVPKAITGKMTEAKALAMGIQKERMEKIYSLMEQLK